ncbi:MAG: tetratricopeptide repeat protein [Sphingomonas sp.]|nr:tetratricopeptide repeat protein [Sphingomonas sp.]
MFRILLVLAALGSAGAARAETEYYTGYSQIMRGDYAAAQSMIEKELKAGPRDADLLLNLAFVYTRTGRRAEAAALYRQVLALPDDEMMSNGGTVMSHDLAERGLKRLTVLADCRCGQ